MEESRKEIPSSMIHKNTDMSLIESAIHFNRDENSFTARLFERLILKFETDNNLFNSFLSSIEGAAIKNKQTLKNDSLQPPSFPQLSYKDSMPFLENLDLYSFCKNNGLEIEISQDKVDKTEFDFVIIAEGELKDQVVIVFEVKCFTDLRQDEIVRQNNLLSKYCNAKLFPNFYHIALISNENIVRGRITKEAFPDVVNFSIISWDDIKSFIDYKRIKKEIELSQLKKTVHLDGTSETKRCLINNSHVGK
jgi:hypothetical protein